MTENPNIIKNGFWIQEKNGVLSMGPIGGDDDSSYVVPPALAEKIHKMEEDMIDAMYGESALKFDPEKGLNIRHLIRNAIYDGNPGEYKVLVNCAEEIFLTGRHKAVETIFRELIRNSITHVLPKSGQGKIKIDISSLVGNLCILYRDGATRLEDSGIQNIVEIIRDQLDGDIISKTTETGKPFIEIIVPVD